ncbi:hypothetical protein BB65665_16178 [Bacillus sp. 916]|nr:hypothetical protein BAMY6639_20155 [Bacillus amyloliquefaciens UMAF6639]EJD66502.1 hypothetical protein BB65665_16178 [Bacillus sp. 916]
MKKVVTFQIKFSETASVFLKHTKKERKLLIPLF